jgi:uncharacterized protein YciW
MDWHKIKRHAAQFDALLAKKVTVHEVDEEVSHALAIMIYADAQWLVSHPKDERKAAAERIPELTRQDTVDMAKLIMKGEIP